MKHIAFACFTLILCALILVPQQYASAQALATKRVGISPRTVKGPTGSNEVYGGVRAVGVKSPVWLRADTTGSGTNIVSSFSWTITMPSGSQTTFDSYYNSSNDTVKFYPDTSGYYIVTVTAGGKTSTDSIFASTYVGQSMSGGNCGACHSGFIRGDEFTPWKTTGHAVMFGQGLTGQLEVDATTGKGLYAPTCLRCHTVGWDPTKNNGNFGYLAKQTGFDTTWYKSYTKAGSMYSIPYKDSTALKLMNASYSSIAPTATIGCEACHGPGKDHISNAGSKTMIGLSLSADVCNACHDAPTHHMVPTEFRETLHSTMPSGSHANSTSCFPCHSGTAFVKWTVNKTSPGYTTAADGGQPITCAVCHDPHGGPNPNQLRTVSIDSLKNGFKPAAGVGGKGLLCMNCHQSRYSIKARVTSTAPYYGFTDRFGPHENPQADMFFGSNAYEYGIASVAGMNTHTGLTDGCVTCHMASGHSLDMQDTTGTGTPHDNVTACKSCHGAGITKFDDIQAPADYDGNGIIQGVQTEVQGLLNLVKSKLPIDSTTGEPVNMRKDSLRVKNHPEIVQAIYDYYFVKNDKSLGIHNTKYAVTLLRSAIGTLTGVEMASIDIPKEFALSQNYPNPFNPSTTIQFSIPDGANVRLVVFDLLGRVVTTLVDSRMSPGTYKFTWDGRNEAGQTLSSGVYFYRLQANDRVSTKKMLLMK